MLGSGAVQWNGGKPSVTWLNDHSLGPNSSWYVQLILHAHAEFLYACKQVDGTNEPSFVGDLLRDGVEDPFTIKWAGSSMSAAGPDTVRIIALLN